MKLDDYLDDYIEYMIINEEEEAHINEQVTQPEGKTGCLGWVLAILGIYAFLKVIF